MIFCREGGRADDDENLLVANQLLVDHAVSAGFLNAPAQDRLHKSLPYAVISKFAKSDEAATVTEDDVALMREYVALLKEAKELAQWHPDESDVKELAGYVADLKESAELSASTA
jgi:hypothetical protein